MNRKINLKLIVVSVIMGVLLVGQLVVAATKPEPEMGQVQEVNIITPHKIEIKGKDLDLKDKMIKIVGPRGAAYEVKYDDKEKLFVLPKDEMTVGVPYTLRLDFATVPKQYESISIPCVLEVKMTSPKTLEVVFDTSVDLESATKASNYWIRTNEDKPSGIASLGKEDNVLDTNALKASQVTIAPKDGSNKVMVMTFTTEAMPKVQYSLIPCFINREASKGYRGGNFVSSSKLDFKIQ